MINIEITKISLCDYLESLPRNIVLYGAGAFGKELADVFVSHSITPKAFLDRNAHGYCKSIPIFHPEDFPHKQNTIILAIVLHKTVRAEIINYLHELGYQNIIDGQIIRAHYVEFEKNYEINEKDIEKPLSYLEDEESISTYRANINAHFRRDYTHCVESDSASQYFIDIPNNTMFRTFVDCGAYIGDTFLEAQKQYIEIKKYYGFEPIKENFLKLQESTKNIDAILYNNAVSNASKLVFFDNKLGSSVINEAGNIAVNAIRLDDVILDSVDFLKMDIEGEEMNALQGAQKLICQYRPNLAICVYHYINHFWDIPNFIHTLNLGYKFYLRAHSSACMETVLYAIKGR